MIAPRLVPRPVAPEYATEFHLLLQDLARQQARFDPERLTHPDEAIRVLNLQVATRTDLSDADLQAALLEPDVWTPELNRIASLRLGANAREVDLRTLPGLQERLDRLTPWCEDVTDLDFALLAEPLTERVLSVMKAPDLEVLERATDLANATWIARYRLALLDNPHLASADRAVVVSLLVRQMMDLPHVGYLSQNLEYRAMEGRLPPELRVEEAPALLGIRAYLPDLDTAALEAMRAWHPAALRAILSPHRTDAEREFLAEQLWEEKANQMIERDLASGIPVSKDGLLFLCRRYPGFKRALTLSPATRLLSAPDQTELVRYLLVEDVELAARFLSDHPDVTLSPVELAPILARGGEWARGQAKARLRLPPDPGVRR
jgi:hypothetical protein